MVGTLLSIVSVVALLALGFSAEPREWWAEAAGGASPLVVAGGILGATVVLVILGYFLIAPFRTWGFWMTGVALGSVVAFVILAVRGHPAFGAQLLLVGASAFVSQYIVGTLVRADEVRHAWRGKEPSAPVFEQRQGQGRAEEKPGPADILFMTGHNATEADLPHAGDLMSIVMGRYSPRDPVLLAEGVAKQPPKASETVAVDVVAQGIWKTIANRDTESFHEAINCGVPYVLRFREYLKAVNRLPAEEDDK